MKVIIAGPRYVTDFGIVKQAIEASGFNITQVVSGGARGVDTLGEIWARANGIKFVRFPADWNKHGKSAGPIRNQEMAKYADALVVIIFPNSKGSTNMFHVGNRNGLKIYMEEYKYDKDLEKYIRANFWRS